jgi:hypothetical protein
MPTSSFAVNPLQPAQIYVYRNSIKALNWFSSIRTILDDPDYAPWFLKFVPGGVFPNGTWHVPACDNNFKPPKCSALYHDQVQSPEYPHGDGSCAQPCDCGKNVRALPAGRGVGEWDFERVHGLCEPMRRS